MVELCHTFIQKCTKMFLSQTTSVLKIMACTISDLFYFSWTKWQNIFRYTRFKRLHKYNFHTDRLVKWHDLLQKILICSFFNESKRLNGSNGLFKCLLPTLVFTIKLKTALLLFKYSIQIISSFFSSYYINNDQTWGAVNTITL